MTQREIKLVVNSIETGLGSVYAAESKISEALVNINSFVSSKQLSELIKYYIKQADGQTKQMKRMFTLLGKNIVENDHAANFWLDQCEDLIIKESRMGATLDRSVRSLLLKVVLSKICTYNVIFSFTESIHLHIISTILENIIEGERKIFKELRDMNIPIVHFDFNNPVFIQ